MEGSTASAWGASSRLVAADRWRLQSSYMGHAVTEALVDYAHPTTGMHVIDLASGTGEPGITLARLVSPQGKVTALDQSSDLLAIAVRRAKERRLDNFETRAADAHRLPFPDQTFDLATCRFGVMFFAHPVEAMVELRRVLRPDARACFVAWGSFEQPYWQCTMKIIHQHAGGTMLEPGGPDPFRFSVAGSLSEVLRSAGFREVEESTRSVPWTWPGKASEILEYARSCSTPFQPMLARVQQQNWPTIMAEAQAAIERYRVGDEIQFGAEIVLASGKK
jgi:ubiquinone/menaquinone biosynthesis C-methylase UbiE